MTTFGETGVTYLPTYFDTTMQKFHVVSSREELDSREKYWIGQTPNCINKQISRLDTVPQESVQNTEPKHPTKEEKQNQSQAKVGENSQPEENPKSEPNKHPKTFREYYKNREYSNVTNVCHRLGLAQCIHRR